jgi:hypothetical protein
MDSAPGLLVVVLVAAHPELAGGHRHHVAELPLLQPRVDGVRLVGPQQDVERLVFVPVPRDADLVAARRQFARPDRLAELAAPEPDVRLARRRRDEETPRLRGEIPVHLPAAPGREPARNRPERKARTERNSTAADRRALVARPSYRPIAPGPRAYSSSPERAQNVRRFSLIFLTSWDHCPFSSPSSWNSFVCMVMWYSSSPSLLYWWVEVSSVLTM